MIDCASASLLLENSLSAANAVTEANAIVISVEFQLGKIAILTFCGFVLSSTQLFDVFYIQLVSLFLGVLIKPLDITN